MRHVASSDTPDALASCPRCQDDVAHAVEDVHAGAGAAVQGRRVCAALLRPARPHQQRRVPGGSQLTVSPDYGALASRATAWGAHAASAAWPCAAGDLKLQHAAHLQSPCIHAGHVSACGPLPYCQPILPGHMICREVCAGRVGGGGPVCRVRWQRVPLVPPRAAGAHTAGPAARRADSPHGGRPRARVKRCPLRWLMCPFCCTATPRCQA